MIDSSLPIVLDACALANYSLCDTLLRLAEPPALVDYLTAELRAHFGEAWISGYEGLLAEMTNEEKDRHVTAAAIHAGAPIIVTFNLRHFGAEHLRPWALQALHPQRFLLGLFESDPDVVLQKLRQQAADRGRSLEKLLGILHSTVPEFAAVIGAASKSG